MSNVFTILKTISLLKKEHLARIISLMAKIKPIADIAQKKEIINPFNIILASSDIYYYENYHSDIMKYIFENKKDTIKYFIEYINGLSDLPKIDQNNYINTEIVREENKIDILIRDLTSKHCIIIENKINNAGDMRRQLPRYYETIINDKYIVDRILYYSLDGTKRPDKTTWKDNDYQLGIEKIIVYGAASNNSGNDFINAFLKKCKDNTDNEQEKSFYCQYVDLLQYLRRNQMDEKLMENFYKEMMNAEQYSSALSLRTMLNDLIVYRRDRILKYFLNNYSPFLDKPNPWSSNDVFFEYIKKIDSKELIKLDIFSEQDNTKILFWIQEPKTKSDLIGKILSGIGEKNNFIKKEDNSYVKLFKFPEEDELMYQYVTKFLSLLDEYKDKI